MSSIFGFEKYKNGILADTEFQKETDETLVPISNLIHPIAWETVFGNAAPVELDLGCGDGGFLTEYVLENPDKNFFATERLMGRINKIRKKSKKIQIKNIKVARIESAYFLKYLVPPNSLSAIHLYFPDPWPKKRHEKYRLVQTKFANICQKSLLFGGTIYLRTDNKAYYEQILANFDNEKLLEKTTTPKSLIKFQTDFEKHWLQMGLSTYYAAYKKTPTVFEFQISDK